MNKDRILKMAKGYYGRNKNCYRIAKPRVEKGLLYQYRDRRQKKRETNKAWLLQINAATRYYGISYSRFAHGLVRADCHLNRKMLASLAVTEPFSFRVLANVAKQHSTDPTVNPNAAEVAGKTLVPFHNPLTEVIPTLDTKINIDPTLLKVSEKDYTKTEIHRHPEALL